jgi:hypothetical protein
MYESRQRRRVAIRAKGGRPFIVGIQWRDSGCTMVFNTLGSGLKIAVCLARMEPRVADTAASTSPFDNSPQTEHSNTIQGFQKLTLLRQLVAFQKRFRQLELPLPEIRSEFDRNTSNAGMPQSEMRA